MDVVIGGRCCYHWSMYDIIDLRNYDNLKSYLYNTNIMVIS